LNTGAHSGSLWQSNGQRLAVKASTGETASGWQTITFDTPVPIVPGTTYVASYHSAIGRYAVTSGQFGAKYDHAPLHVPAGGGAWHYGPDGGVYPANTSNSNYWVDISFTPNS